MLFNYLKLSLRLLIRNPFFTGINVLGLAVGFASFFILWQYSTTELKSDEFHKDFERIVRVGSIFEFTDDGKSRGSIPNGALAAFHAPMLANDFPQIGSYTRILQQPSFRMGLVKFAGFGGKIVISVDGKNQQEGLFEETQMIYADQNLFDFFTIPLLRGNKETVLQKANSVVLSKTTAAKYFGEADPEGKILVMNDTVLLTVTGVYQDLPRNTHLAFDLVVSNAGLESVWQNSRYLFVSSYLKMNAASRLHDFEEEINKKHDQYWGIYSMEFPSWKFRMFIQPLNEIVFGPPHQYAYFQSKSKPILILLQAVSIFILFMAWINYINLSVSRMIKRMKEVATRKMSGAVAADFVKQFFIESILINMLAVGVAFTITQLVRVPLDVLLNIHIPEFVSITTSTWLIFALVVVMGILITGLYPILMSVSYTPRSLLMISKKAPKTRVMQTLLTTGQYSMALILIQWAFIVYLQLNYILHKNVGIEREQIVVIDAPLKKSSTYPTDFSYFLNEVRSISNVREATYSRQVVGDDNSEIVPIRAKVQGNSIRISMDSNGGVDQSFIPFYGIKMIAGRNFIPSDRSDAVILSRHGTERLGYANPEGAIGERVNDGAMVIVGVMEDYRFSSLINPGVPSSYAFAGRGICLVYDNANDSIRVTPEKISLKVQSMDVGQIMDEVRLKYNASFPGNMFTWYFLDDHINKAYASDVINRNQIALFTLLAIGISCLGLLGMITTLAEDKTKEIGIRKVLGATAEQMGGRLVNDIFRQVYISVLIALPISYYLGNQYLERYLEKINLQWWHFSLPVFILLLIMLATIASVLYKAARTNPVESLRSE